MSFMHLKIKIEEKFKLKTKLTETNLKINSIQIMQNFSASKHFLNFLTLSYPGGGRQNMPLHIFLHHPKTAQGVKLKLSDVKDTLL